MKNNPICRVCKESLTSDNWYSAGLKNSDYVCRECKNIQQCLYREANRDKVNAAERLHRKENPEKAKAMSIRASRKRGVLPMSENKECASYLGVYIGEQILGRVFKNVVRMPYGHPGYDFICNNDKLIDVKISCTRKNQNSWTFGINYNTTADYFLLVAFDNRTDLNPLHIWLIPGHVLSHLMQTSISESTLDKWAEYKKPINGVITCCDTMKKGEQ